MTEIDLGVGGLTIALFVALVRRKRVHNQRFALSLEAENNSIYRAHLIYSNT